MDLSRMEKSDAGYRCRRDLGSCTSSDRDVLLLYLAGPRTLPREGPRADRSSTRSDILILRGGPRWLHYKPAARDGASTSDSSGAISPGKISAPAPSPAPTSAARLSKSPRATRLHLPTGWEHILLLTGRGRRMVRPG